MSGSTVSQAAKVVPPTTETTVTLVADTASTAVDTGVTHDQWVSIVSDVDFNVRFGSTSSVTAPTSFAFFGAKQMHDFHLTASERYFKLISPSAGEFKWWVSGR